MKVTKWNKICLKLFFVCWRQSWLLINCSNILDQFVMLYVKLYVTVLKQNVQACDWKSFTLLPFEHVFICIALSNYCAAKTTKVLSQWWNHHHEISHLKTFCQGHTFSTSYPFTKQTQIESISWFFELPCLTCSLDIKSPAQFQT